MRTTMQLRDELATLDENIADMTRTLLRRVDRLGGGVEAWQDAQVMAMDGAIDEWQRRRDALVARVTSATKRQRRTA